MLNLLILATATAFAATPDLARDPGWLALGHYQKKGSGYESLIVGQDWFLAPDGRTNPQAELDATIKALDNPQTQCDYPARARWLGGKLRRRLEPADCPKLKAWLEGIDPAGVTLVFANAFLGNPSSMFGHTFLRVRRRSGVKGEDLLDYTINYSGVPQNNEDFWDGLRGLTGKLPGKFSADPYYLKIQEYTNMEARDLWEYDLKLEPAEVDFLLDHAWELTRARFKYYFFTQNCSYQLLTLVDAARPDLRLEKGFGLGVVPADTVRAFLSKPGLIGDIRFRPSHVTQLRARRARLSSNEAALADRIGKLGPMAGLDALPPERRALVLDSADDVLRYREGFSNALSTAAANAERAILISRGRLGLGPLPAAIVPPHRLEEGHDSARWGFAAGVSRNSSFEEISWRGALHDFAAPDYGYLPDSQLQALNTRLRVDNKSGEVYVEKLDLVDIMSVPALESWHRKPAWKVSTGIDQAKELGCGPVACMNYDLDGGMGLAAETHLIRKELYYAFLESDFSAAPVFHDGWRIGAGGTIGLGAEETESLKTTVEATYIGYLNSPSRERWRLTQSFRLSRDLELRLNLDRRVPEQEAGASIFWYF